MDPIKGDEPTPQTQLEVHEIGQIAVDLIETATHILLYLRQLYPPRFFEATRCSLTRLIVPRCRNKEVCEYIQQSLLPLKSAVCKGTASQVIVVLLRTLNPSVLKDPKTILITQDSSSIEQSLYPVEQLSIDIINLTRKLLADTKSIRKTMEDDQGSFTIPSDEQLIDSLKVEFDSVYIHEQMRGLIYKLYSLQTNEVIKDLNLDTPSDSSFQIMLELVDSCRPNNVKLTKLLPNDSLTSQGYPLLESGHISIPPKQVIDLSKVVHENHSIISGEFQSFAKDSNINAFGEFIEVPKNSLMPNEDNENIKHNLNGVSIIPIRKLDLGLIQLRFHMQQFKYSLE